MSARLLLPPLMLLLLLLPGGTAGAQDLAVDPAEGPPQEVAQPAPPELPPDPSTMTPAMNQADWSWEWLMAELDPDEQVRFSQLYARYYEGEQMALLDLSDLLPEGDRGIMAVQMLRMQPHEAKAFVTLLEYLGPHSRRQLAGRGVAHDLRRWDVLATYAAAASPDEVAWSLFVGDGQAGCPEPAFPAMPVVGPEQPASEAATDEGPVIGCSDATLAFMRDWNRRSVRVIEGRDVRPGEAPWQAQLIRSEAGLRLWQTPRLRRAEVEAFGGPRPDWENRHVCGGTYIGNGWVLTAAHCLEGWTFADVSELMRVRLGATSAETGGQEYAVSAVVVHAAYRGRSTDWQHDIALMRLTGPVATSGVRTATIPRGPGRARTIAQPLMLTGWGITGTTFNASANRDRFGRVQRYSHVLQQGDMYLRDPATCGDSGQLDGVTIWPGQLCAGSRAGVDACRGDSGGPLVLPSRNGRELVGIVSYGAGCGLAGTAKIFTDVGFYASWIRAAQGEPSAGRLVRFACGLAGYSAC